MSSSKDDDNDDDDDDDDCRAEPALRVDLESLNKVRDGPNSRIESSTTKNPALDHLSFEMRRFIASYAANVVFVSKPVENLHEIRLLNTFIMVSYVCRNPSPRSRQ